MDKVMNGHEYILVLVDYAIRYPKAVPLHKATSKNIARELLLLFSQVIILKDLLTNQDTPFMSYSWLTAAGQTALNLHLPLPDRWTYRKVQQNLQDDALAGGG